MPCKIRLANDEIVVGIQFPEFAVNNIKVLIGEVLCDEIDVIFSLQTSQDVEEVGTSQLAQADATRPGGVGAEEDARHHSRHVACVKFRCSL